MAVVPNHLCTLKSTAELKKKKNGPDLPYEDSNFISLNSGSSAPMAARVKNY
jgi:hypothetical protein